LVTVIVREAGGMGDEPLVMYWSFRRHGVELLGIHGSSELVLATHSGEDWMYSSRIDFVVEYDVLRPGDEFVVWVEGSDLAGHSLVGHGSVVEPRMPLLRVIYFHPVLSDISVEPDAPMVEESILVEGRVTNNGTSMGEVKIGLWALQKSGGRLELNSTTITLLPQQHQLFAFELEAWKTGDLQLYIALDDDMENLTSVPVDRVRSPTNTEAFLASLSSASALGLLLLILAMLTMGVLLWRREDEDWFDDDEEYDDSELSEEGDEDDDDERAADELTREALDKDPPPPPWAPDEWPEGAGPPPEILTESLSVDEEE